jgi:type IV secretory pathway TrbL component
MNILVLSLLIVIGLSFLGLSVASLKKKKSDSDVITSVPMISMLMIALAIDIAAIVVWCLSGMS